MSPRPSVPSPVHRARGIHASLFFASVVALPLAAQEPARDPHAVQPERPTVATHAHTVAPGWLELEAGGEYDHYADASHGALTPFTAKLGLTAQMQLTIQAELAAPPRVSLGLGDASVGIKWRVLDDVPLLGDFAILPSVKLPTGSGPYTNPCLVGPCSQSPGTGTGTTDISLLLISSHTWGPISLDLNVGYTRRSGNGSAAPIDATLWAASFSGSLTGPVGWVAELHGFPGTTGLAGQPNSVRVLGGPTFALAPWLACDLGGTLSLTGQQPDALYAGGVINVGRVW